MKRYAIYLAPPANAPLMQFANHWLGRDPYTGDTLPQPEIGLEPAQFAGLTVEAAHYGFHGTLKAPFELAPDRTADELHEAVRTLAEGHRPFSIDLQLSELGGFLALTPREPLADLDDLAATCVEELDPFRAPLSEADVARRNPDRLTPEQQDYLRRYGYPHIFEYFRYHMTLSARLEPADREVLWPVLEGRMADLLRQPFDVDALTIFEQQDRKSPFIVTGRYPFEGPA